MAVVEKERLKCTGVRQVRDRVLGRLAREEARMAGAETPRPKPQVGSGPELTPPGTGTVPPGTEPAPPGTETEILHVGTAPSPVQPEPYSPPQPQPPLTGAPVPETLRPEACPFDLEVATPYAVDLRRLCELSGTKVPPEIEAKLGASVPVLIYHRMTPFAQAGERSHGIWGMGYAVRLTGLPSATTVDLVPGTKLTTLVSTKFKVAADAEIGGKIGLPSPLVNIGVGVGGELGVAGDLAAAAGPAVPGWPISDATLSVSADAQFAFVLGLDLDLSLLEVQAGPVGAGGARWNLYRRGKRIDVTQSLVHTLTVPKGVTGLKLRVTTWICESGLLGRPATRWTFAKTFPVSLEGLGG